MAASSCDSKSTNACAEGVEGWWRCERGGVRRCVRGIDYNVEGWLKDRSMPRCMLSVGW